MNTKTASQSAESGGSIAEHGDEQSTSASPAPPLPHLSNQARGGGEEKNWWGTSLKTQGKHQESTMPANFAQMFEENFQQGLGERNSSRGKFNEISSNFMGMNIPPSTQVSAHFPVQRMSDSK